MNLWIRAQDKEFLMKVDNINLGLDVDTNEPTRIFTFVDGTVTSFTLGTYKSKERALEVLDEIDSKIMMNKVIEIYSNLGDLTFANRANYTYTPIYQMPNE